MARWPRLVASIGLLAVPLGWRAERRYRQMPALECEAGGAALSRLPSLSIIVPARDEERNLKQLLPSLCALDYPGPLEIIVVDDHSADRTAAVAAEFDVHVISLDRLPRGWLGKPHACHQGAATAGGDWLLFTDADTVHAPRSAARAVGHAERAGFDGLSLHLSHSTRGWLDGVTLLTAFAGLFAGLPARTDMLNGQYILLRRDVYQRSGGFAAVRQEALEDLALGRYLRDQGYHTPMLRGEEVAQVAMYNDAGHLWRGMSRLGAGSLRFAGAGRLITILIITALMTPLLALRLALTRELSPRWVGLAWAAAIAGAWPWAGRFGPRWRVLLAPLGALIVQLSAVWGLANRLIGRGIQWKGRQV